MTNDEILAKATQGEWRVEKDAIWSINNLGACDVLVACRPSSHYIGHYGWESNAALIALAKNSYKRDQRVIAALTLALEQAKYSMSNYVRGEAGYDFGLITIDAALALAKEASE